MRHPHSWSRQPVALQLTEMLLIDFKIENTKKFLSRLLPNKALTHCLECPGALLTSWLFAALAVVQHMSMFARAPQTERITLLWSERKGLKPHSNWPRCLQVQKNLNGKTQLQYLKILTVLPFPSAIGAKLGNKLGSRSLILNITDMPIYRLSEQTLTYCWYWSAERSRWRKRFFLHQKLLCSSPITTLQYFSPPDCQEQHLLS